MLKHFEAMKAGKLTIRPKSQPLFHKNLPQRDFSICNDFGEKQQAAAQEALRVRMVIPKAKGHYWLFSGDKERTRKRPECRWYVLVFWCVLAS